MVVMMAVVAVVTDGDDAHVPYDDMRLQMK